MIKKLKKLLKKILLENFGSYTTVTTVQEGGNREKMIFSAKKNSFLG